MPPRRFERVCLIVLSASVIALLLVQPGHAQTDLTSGSGRSPVAPADLCAEAVRAAEARHSLPSGLLFAISQVESGRPDAAKRRLEPWPWTVQAEDKSFYFDSKAEAVQWVRDAMARGVDSIDTGCLQVNLFFHPRAFATLDDAFDPRHNADYAARFLLQLYASTGDWRKATGFYHSQTTMLAIPYEDRVERRLNEVGAGWTSPPKPPSLLTQLADAWRVTRGTVATDPAGSTGNDWSVLLRLAHRPPGPPLLPALARARSRGLSQVAATH